MPFLIESVRILPVTFPLKNTFRTHLGQKKETRNVIAVLECSGGVQGLGEASGSLALPESRQETMIGILSKASREVLNQSPRDRLRISETLRKKYPGHPTAVSALECALLDADLKSRKKSGAAFFGGKSKTLETFYTVPALPLAACEKIVRKMGRFGFRRFKIKVDGTDSRADFERVKRIREWVSKPSLIIDANQAWNGTDCLKFVEKCESQNLPALLLEQPLPKRDLRGMAFVKKRSSIPVAADESFRCLEDVKKILDLDAADVFNIKIAKCGLTESLRIASYLKGQKKKLMIGCMMESPLGLAASIQWACGSGDFSFIDLDSFLLMEETGMEKSFSARGAFLKVRGGSHGLGITGPEKIP